MDIFSQTILTGKETDEMNLSGYPLDWEYIQGIRLGNKKLIDRVYTQCFPKIKHMILKNSGNEEDARDIFQETLIAIYKNAQNPEFKLTCRFTTYLYAIARNLWFMALRKRNVQYTDMEHLTVTEHIDDMDETIKSMERYQLYTESFRKLGEQCRKLLMLFMQGVTMKKIAGELGFASESYAKKRKFKCKEKLIALITEDKDYKRLTENE